VGSGVEVGLVVGVGVLLTAVWPWILILGAPADSLLASTERPPSDTRTNDNVVREPSISRVMSRWSKA
jgi:hypothetical protein